MEMVRTKEAHAEAIAHMLDDVLRVPGTRMRMGVDPLLGLVPVIGDAIATLLGMAILVIARQLNVPWRIVAQMGLNQLKNGLIGAIPFIGDAYSFNFKSNAVNTALLLRAVKRGEDGTCLLTPRSITMQDVAGLAVLILPTVALVAFVRSGSGTTTFLTCRSSSPFRTTAADPASPPAFPCNRHTVNPSD